MTECDNTDLTPAETQTAAGMVLNQKKDSAATFRTEEKHECKTWPTEICDSKKKKKKLILVNNNDEGYRIDTEEKAADTAPVLLSPSLPPLLKAELTSSTGFQYALRPGKGGARRGGAAGGGGGGEAEAIKQFSNLFSVLNNYTLIIIKLDFSMLLYYHCTENSRR